MQQIVIVDENDNFIGEEEKEKCHDGNGILHRGFLVMVFNNKRELLLARRSEKKRLWPGFWDGTIASHIVKGEDYIQASKRRLTQEIGLINNNVKYLFKFRYYVRYKNIGAENEICGVTTVDGIDNGRIFPDSKEISDIKFISTRVLIDDLRKNENKYTPWLILAMDHMNKRQIL
jgi:isopentenyl-diphosphate delta-isomerase